MGLFFSKIFGKKIKRNKAFTITSKKNRFLGAINALAARYRVVDQAFLEDFTKLLVSYNFGQKMSQTICHEIESEFRLNAIKDPNSKQAKEIIALKLIAVYNSLKTETSVNIYTPRNKLTFISISGVNGTGKTTSIAKLAYYYQQQHKKVLVIAGDVFRAGAVNQLKKWANEFDFLFCQGVVNDKFRTVVYKGLAMAIKNNVDVIICDTAGRLPNQKNLMIELSQMNQILQKFKQISSISHLLVIDAYYGQSSISQATKFKDFLPLTGIFLSKLDICNKCGVIFTIKANLGLPILFTGTGEEIINISEFKIQEFVNELFFDSERM